MMTDLWGVICPFNMVCKIEFWIAPTSPLLSLSFSLSPSVSLFLVLYQWLRTGPWPLPQRFFCVCWIGSVLLTHGGSLYPLRCSSFPHFAHSSFSLKLFFSQWPSCAKTLIGVADVEMKDECFVVCECVCCLCACVFVSKHLQSLSKTCIQNQILVWFSFATFYWK